MAAGSGAHPSFTAMVFGTGEGHVFEAWQLHLEATLEIGGWKGANLGAMEVRDT